VLLKVCRDLARNLVRGGEGVTKLVDVVVKGGWHQEDAKKVAYAIAHSPLVKTAFFGEDCNWGRILCAAGYSGAKVDPDRIDLFFDKCPVVKKGMTVGLAGEAKAAKVLKNPAFKVTVDLHQGKGEFSVLTCDLSLEYVKINGSYRS
jgi:glutamate N-acetyltransferase/amino-acid N-acetyltransferase